MLLIIIILLFIGAINTLCCTSDTHYYIIRSSTSIQSAIALIQDIMEMSTIYNYSITGSLSTLAPFTYSNYTNGTDQAFSIPDVVLPESVQILQAVIYIIELIIGTGLSLFLISLILLCKSLRQRGFAIAVQILLANAAFAIPVLSAGIKSALDGDWTLGDNSCRFIAFCNQSFHPQRWFLMAVWVIDRVLTIQRPLRYEKHGAKLVAIMSFIAFLGGLLTGILPLTTLNVCNGIISILNTCHILFYAQQDCGVYAFTYLTITFIIGGILPFCLYIWMFHKAKKAVRQIQPTPQSQISSAAIRPSVTRKQLTTIFVQFWTLLGCSSPTYFSILCIYFSYIAGWQGGLYIGIILLILLQPLYYGLLIADPIALMWHKDVKQELHKLKYNAHNYLKFYVARIVHPTSS